MSFLTRQPTTTLRLHASHNWRRRTTSLALQAQRWFAADGGLLQYFRVGVPCRTGWPCECHRRPQGASASWQAPPNKLTVFVFSKRFCACRGAIHRAAVVTVAPLALAGDAHDAQPLATTRTPANTCCYGCAWLSLLSTTKAWPRDCRCDWSARVMPVVPRSLAA